MATVPDVGLVLMLMLVVLTMIAMVVHLGEVDHDCELGGKKTALWSPIDPNLYLQAVSNI